MNTIRLAFLSSTLLVAACGSISYPTVRPLPMASTEKVSPFEVAYEAGKRHLLADRAGLAIVMFERALTIEPRSVAALNASGAAYDELHRPEAAKRYYLKALAVEPNSADTLNNMAVSAMIAGDDTAARALLARAADLDATNPTIRENMQIAGLGPMPEPIGEPVIVQDAPVADEDRPAIERTGFTEYTLTIPAIMRKVTDWLFNG